MSDPDLVLGLRGTLPSLIITFYPYSEGVAFSVFSVSSAIEQSEVESNSSDDPVIGQ